MFLLTDFVARHAEVQLLLSSVKWYLVLHTQDPYPFNCIKKE